MNNREQDIELIEAYLAKQLSEKEREAIDIRLNSDHHFKKLFNEVAILTEGIKKSKKLELLQKLQLLEYELSEEWTDEEKVFIDQIDNNIITKTTPLPYLNKPESELPTLIQGIVFQKKKKLFHSLKKLEESLPDIHSTKKREVNIFSIRNLLSAAAVIILLFLAGWWFLQDSASPSDQLFTEYFVPYSTIGNKRTLPDEKKSLENQALFFYSNKDYKAAIPLLTQWYESDKNTISLLYLGIAHLGNNQPNEAIENLNQFCFVH